MQTQRSIYGFLKQASLQWKKRFDEEIKKFGFTQNRDEHVYIAKLVAVMLFAIESHELSNEMCASTPEEVAYTEKNVPYVFGTRRIFCYAVRCTRPDVEFAQNFGSVDINESRKDMEEQGADNGLRCLCFWGCMQHKLNTWLLPEAVWRLCGVGFCWRSWSDAFNINNPIIMYCDNSAQSYEPMFLEL
ncbi:hypothetical protein Tco_1304110 [Tanacetum coccineum]